MNETLHCKDIVQCTAEDKSSKEIILKLRSWSKNLFYLFKKNELEIIKRCID